MCILLELGFVRAFLFDLILLQSKQMAGIAIASLWNRDPPGDIVEFDSDGSVIISSDTENEGDDPLP